MKIGMGAKVITLILIAGLFFTNGCTGKKTSTHNQAVWSSKDPFTIPYQVRNMQKNSGNLVHNPSFELGKFFSSDTIVENLPTGVTETQINQRLFKFRLLLVYEGCSINISSCVID